MNERAFMNGTVAFNWSSSSQTKRPFVHKWLCIEESAAAD